MAERATLTTTVIVSAIRPGNPPSLAFSARLPGAGGREKVLSQQVAVSDPMLFDRLQAEVEPGDAVEVTVATEWDDEHYTTSLVDFSVADGPVCEHDELPDSLPDTAQRLQRFGRRDR